MYQAYDTSELEKLAKERLAQKQPQTGESEVIHERTNKHALGNEKGAQTKLEEKRLSKEQIEREQSRRRFEQISEVTELIPGNSAEPKQEEWVKQWRR